MCAFPKLENDSLTLLQGNEYILDFRFNRHSYFAESGSRKHFYASGMRAIDFSHDVTPYIGCFGKKISIENDLLSDPFFKITEYTGNLKEYSRDNGTN